jgi:hypothetical protein
MRVLVGLLTCLWAGELSTAVAADPPPTTSTSGPAPQSSPPAAPASKPNQSAPVPTASAPSSAAVAAPGTTPAASDRTLSSAEEKRLISAGYKVETRSDGEKYYCRREAVLGSRFESKVCKTAQQIKTAREQDQDNLNQQQVQHKLNGS